MAKNNIKRFEYTARNKQGKVVTETTTATTATAVEDALIRQGYTPYSVEEKNDTGFNMEIKIGKGGKTKLKHIATWARQFSIMTDAGLPAIQSLNILAIQTENPNLREITSDITREIEAGAGLGEALEEHVDVFGDLMVNMVKSGESGGFLDKSLRQAADDIEAQIKLRSKVKSAMTYPLVILGMAVLMCTAMLLFIVPIFAGLFASLGGSLPAPTQVLVTLSDLLKIGIIPLIALIVIFVFWWRKNKREEWVRNILDPFKLKVPVFGKLTTKIAISRFSRNLSALLSSGVPIIKSLDIVSQTVGNVVISRALDDVKHSIEAGNSMAEPLSQHDVFPPMVVRMIKVGEDAGNLEAMLGKIADDYDLQVETTTEQLASLIEPIMITFLGTVVGGMVIALYMPIFKITELVGQQA